MRAVDRWIFWFAAMIVNTVFGVKFRLCHVDHDAVEPMCVCNVSERASECVCNVFFAMLIRNAVSQMLAYCHCSFILYLYLHFSFILIHLSRLKFQSSFFLSCLCVSEHIHEKRERVPFLYLFLFFHHSSTSSLLLLVVPRIELMRVHNLFEYTKRNRPLIRFCIINFRLKADELSAEKKNNRTDIQVVFIIFVFF